MLSYGLQSVFPEALLALLILGLVVLEALFTPRHQPGRVGWVALLGLLLLIALVRRSSGSRGDP